MTPDYLPVQAWSVVAVFAEGQQLWSHEAEMEIGRSRTRPTVEDKADGTVGRPVLRDIGGVEDLGAPVAVLTEQVERTGCRLVGDLSRCRPQPMVSGRVGRNQAEQALCGTAVLIAGAPVRPRLLG